MNTSILLRLEGLGVLAAAFLAYHQLSYNWWLFAALFLVPDLFMLGYLANRKLGAAIYNVGHTYFITLPLAIIAYFSGSDLLLAISLIWISHIGFDRLLGYGLKLSSGFKHTHLGSLDKP